MGDPSRQRTRPGMEAWRRAFREAVRASDSYGLLLALLVVDITVVILLPSSSWGRVVQTTLVSLTLLLALHTSEVSRRTRAAGLAVSGLAIASALWQFAFGEIQFGGVTYVSLALLLVITMPAILRRIFGHDEVRAETILGAVCFYLMIGLAFAYLYLAIDAFSDAPFFAQGQSRDPADYVYMSYITLTTIGFGDLTPRDNLGRMLVVMEGLLGQIYLVTTVARIVASYISPTQRERGAG